jgi:enhanced entry protein EnhC
MALFQDNKVRGITMKSFLPWCYLVAVTGSQMVYAVNGFEDYRQGNYSLAAQLLVNQSGKDPVADYYLGQMRLHGYGQLKNNTLALRYFNQAAEKGLLSAQQLLARYYLLKEKDLEKALYWFKKAAAAGDIQAQMYCAAAYMFGLGTKKNSDTARRYHIDAAKNGNPIAQYTLGTYFLESRDQRNKKLGVIWLTKAAEQGDFHAQALLGEMYAQGKMVERDNAKAAELLVKAADQNSLSAMITLGEMAIKQNQLDVGRDWLTKATTGQDPRAEMALARLYIDPKSKLYDPKMAFMWTLHAAQNGYSEAQQALAFLYKEGKGVIANQQLAAQWEQRAKETAVQKPPRIEPEILAARWLSNDKVSKLTADTYGLGGIYSAWQNPQALKENNYNLPPRMEVVTRAELYKPRFTMIQPREVPINEYFDLIAPSLNAHLAFSWTFPRYELDKQIESLQRNESLVLQHSLEKSIVEESCPYIEESRPKPFNYFAEITAGWRQQAIYQVILSQLYNQAILGESAAQFELGQLYHYGVAVAKNPQQAITYYQLAAAQQDVRAEYNLGLLYLEGQTNPVNYTLGISWLTDAAFKGNVYAQYVLANIYDKGFADPTGQIVVQPNQQQALAMYYLASSNNYGPAEYRLADYLVKQKERGLGVAAKHNRVKLIRRLYQGAVLDGVAEAELPLAFYNAMDINPKKQRQALAVARQAGEAGSSEAALLLGVMYERGLSVPANLSESLIWYQVAFINPVNAFVLGTYYSQGTGLDKDLERGRGLLQQAADVGFSYANYNLAVLKHQAGEDFIPELNQAREQGNTTAALLLADYYIAHSNDPERIKQARDIYQYLAEKGDKEGQLKLAYLYDTGLGGEVNLDLATKWYSSAAEQGQPIAQYLLGQLYHLGRIGTQPDYAEAKKWYTAAQAVYPKAAVALGFIYDTVENNYLRALESYQLAVQKKDAVGEFNLALIYDNGKGLSVDYAKARELYSKAAEQGVISAMTKLADIYFTGLGKVRDEQRALQLYKKAADLNDGDALYQLGLFSETGVALQLNFSSAVNFYTRAAAQGNEKAKLALARMYQYGLGVRQDTRQATRLYNELAANNNGYAQYQLALIQFNASGGHKSDVGKRLLQEASANGSLQARKMLQWLDALEQERVSFIEPLPIKQIPVFAGQPAALMYLDALSEWNRGDEELSRSILNHLIDRFPQFVPAKRAYEQLNQPITSFSVGYNEG